MSSYDDMTQKIAERVFKRGDALLERKRNRTAYIKRISFSVSGICALLIIGLGIWRSADIRSAVDVLSNENENIISGQPATSISAYDNAKTTSVAVTEIIITQTTSAVHETGRNVSTASAAVYTTSNQSSIRTTDTISTATTSAQNRATSAVTTTKKDEITSVTTTEAPKPEFVLPKELKLVVTESAASKEPAGSVNLTFSANYHVLDTLALSEITVSIYNRENVNVIDTDNEMLTNADIYEIKDIDSSFAVAVRFAESDGFYIYLNDDYAPVSLGQVITDTGLKSSPLNDISEIRKDEEWQAVQLSNELKNSIWKQILISSSSTGTELTSESSEILRISISPPWLTQEQFIFVSQDGKLWISYIDDICFNIGSDNAEKMISLFHE